MGVRRGVALSGDADADAGAMREAARAFLANPGYRKEAKRRGAALAGSCGARAAAGAVESVVEDDARLAAQ